MSQSPSEVYIRQLLPKKNGFPQYVPEPADDLPAKYRDKGTSIGDVGNIKPDGSFDFAFNICAAADDSINCYGTPDGFEQVAMLPGDISHLNNMFPSGSDVSSASVKKQTIEVEGALKENELVTVPAGVSVGYSFTSASSEAAILTLPDGAARQDLRNIAKFRHHAIHNAPRWYEFVNGTLGREAPNGSLYLVTGCDKSTTWGIASVSSASQTNSLSLKFTASQLVETSATFNYKWETYCPATVRVGPEFCGSSEQLQNQCVFLRGFRMTIRDGPLAALKGPAKVSSVLNVNASNILPGLKRNSTFMEGGKRSWSGKGSRHPNSGGGQQRTNSSQTMPETGSDDEEASDEDVILESAPSISEYHPLITINKHLLDAMPDAQVAITHESDWYNLSNDDFDLPIGDELLSRLHDVYRPSMSSSGVYLIPKDPKQIESWTLASLCGIHNSCVPSKDHDTVNYLAKSYINKWTEWDNHSCVHLLSNDPFPRPPGHQDTSSFVHSDETPSPPYFLQHSPVLIFPESSMRPNLNAKDNAQQQPHNDLVSPLYNSDKETYSGEVATKYLRYIEEGEFIDKVNTMYRDIITPIWNSLSHANICPFISIQCAKGSVPAIQIPFYKQGNIIDYNKHCPSVDKMLQITEIARGLSYLHGKGIRHGNICPANILIENDGRVRISDPCLNFLMRQIMDGEFMRIPESYQYKAPEELLSTVVDAKGDVYSWACVVYEVFSFQRPYHGGHFGLNIHKIINHGHRTLERPSQISTNLWMLLLRCWALIPEDRPSMGEVLGLLELHMSWGTSFFL